MTAGGGQSQWRSWRGELGWRRGVDTQEVEVQAPGEEAVGEDV